MVKAEKLIRRFGFLNEAWRIHAIKADGQSSPEAAIREYRKMVAKILAYRARLSSVTARTSLVEPCLVSIRSYLNHLIAKGTPSSAREALHVISDLRSITLLDEFLLADSGTFSESAQHILGQIRKEVTAEGGDQLPGGPLRLLGKGVWNKPSIIREYLEKIGLSRVNKEQRKEKKECITATPCCSRSFNVISPATYRIDISCKTGSSNHIARSAQSA